MKIAWGITGAGHLLKESVEALEILSSEHEVTVFLSDAGEEVLKMYGLFERVENVTGGYYQELVRDVEQKSSYPIAGRFSLGKYDLLLISPATSNTIGKIVNGIADTLITNIVAQAGKGGIKTFIVPVDLESGDVETVLPSKIELDICNNCEMCEAALACPNDAIIKGAEIKLLQCQGCGVCEKSCPYDAIKGGKIIIIHMRDIDVINSHKLYEFEDLEVLKYPIEIKKLLETS